MLVPVRREEVRRIIPSPRRRPVTCIVPGLPLHLDDRGTEIRKHHRRVGTGEDSREIRHDGSGQRPCPSPAEHLLQILVFHLRPPSARSNAGSVSGVRLRARSLTSCQTIRTPTPAHCPGWLRGLAWRTAGTPPGPPGAQIRRWTCEIRRPPRRDSSYTRAQRLAKRRDER